MAYKEQVDRVAGATLVLRASPTRIGTAGLIAENVEFWPRATISKRGGFRRFMEVRENYPVTAIVNIGEHYLVMAGDLDEQAE